MPVDALDFALDDFAEFDVAQSGDDELRAGLLALLTAQHRVAAQVARLAGEFERRGLAADDAQPTTEAWLRAFARLSDQQSRALLRAARVCVSVPSLAGAFADGEVNAEHVDLLGALAERVPADVLRSAAPILVPLAQHNDPHDLRRACEHLRLTIHSGQYRLARCEGSGSRSDALA
jgi:hypothetical protein